MGGEPAHRAGTANFLNVSEDAGEESPVNRVALDGLLFHRQPYLCLVSEDSVEVRIGLVLEDDSERPRTARTPDSIFGIGGSVRIGTEFGATLLVAGARFELATFGL